MNETLKPTPRLDDQNRPLGSTAGQSEGFHPMRSAGQPVGADSVERCEAKLFDDTIMLDEAQDKQKTKTERPHWRRYLKRSALVLLITLLVGGAYFGYKFYKTSHHVLAGGGQAPAVCDGNVPTASLKTEGDGRVNILMLGIGGEGHQGGDLSDTIMLASLDPVNDKMDLLSIPRDLYVKIPDYGSNKINAAYAFGKQNSAAKDLQSQQRDGVKLADKVIGQILGVPIHYNAVIDFKAFEDSVNALGGVDANVPQEMAAHEVFWIEGSNPAKYYTLDVKAGPNHFDGTRALYFARERHNDSDFVRGQRQRLMLTAIKDKALSIGTLANPIKISNLMNSLGNNVYTDFDTGSIKCLAQQVSQVPSSQITSLDLVTPPHDLIGSAGFSGLSALAPKAGTYNYSQIQAYVRSTLRDSFLAKENSSVAIYNATNVAGLATTKAGELKAYGYNVTVVDNTPNQFNPTTTTLVDLSNGADKYTRHYLEQRFKTTARDSTPSEFGINSTLGTRFVIILGKDAEHTSP